MSPLPGVPRCQGRNRNGDPCGSGAMTDGSGFCFQHNPGIPQSVKTDASRLGGLAHRQDILPDLEEIALKHPKDFKRFLVRMVKHVLGGTLTTSRANSAGFLLRVLAEWEAARRKKADLTVGVTVNIVRFDAGGNGDEATPSPPLAPSPRPRGIASECSTDPQPLPLRGAPERSAP